MKKPALAHLMVISAALTYLVSPSLVFGTFISFSVGGNSGSASIQATVDQFRNALGSPDNASTPGPVAGGRREINWDAGGSTTTTLTGTPLNAFQDLRGALFTTPGTGFVQAPADGFTFANPSYLSTFQAFSPIRLFSPLGSNITDVTFFVPGTAGAVPATVGGFGAIFSDVNLADASRLQFFDFNGNLVYNQAIPPATTFDGGFSFLGAIGTQDEQIFRVRITTGNAALGALDGGPLDVVVLDNVMYREPRALTSVSDTGSTLALFVGALALLGAVRRFVRR